MKLTHATLDNGHHLFIIQAPTGGVRPPESRQDLFKPLIEECRSLYGSDSGKGARWHHEVFAANPGALLPWVFKKTSWVAKGGAWAMMFLTFYNDVDAMQFLVTFDHQQESV